MTQVIAHTTFAQELETLNLKGHFAFIHSEKTVSLKKGFEGQVTIKRTNSVKLGCDYENIVMNKAEKEGVADTVEFEGLPTYLERVNNLVTRHISKGTYYLSAYPNKSKVAYYFNGEKVNLADIEHMMYAKDLPKKTSKPKTQGELSKAVKWRRYSFDNFVRVSINGVKYNF